MLKAIMITTIPFALIIGALFLERHFIKTDKDKYPDYLGSKEYRENLYKIIAAVALYLFLIFLFIVSF